MLTNELNIDQIYYAAETLLERVPDIMIERGLSVYLHRRVEDITFHDSLYISATVQGTHPYRVFVDTDFLEESTCTCPYDHGICKHIIATVCQAMALFDDPVSFFLGEDLMPMDSLPEAEQEPEIVPADRPEQWVEAFEWVFPRFVTSYSYDLTSDYLRFYRDYAKKAAGWSLELRTLYRLHLLLFCLYKLEENLSSSASYHRRRGAFDKLLELLPAILDDSGKRALLTACPDDWRIWASTLSAAVLSPDPSPVDWLAVYRAVWWQFEDVPDLIEEEKERLKAAMAHPSLNLFQKRQIRLAMAHLEIISGQDEAAWDILQPVFTPNQIREMVGYLSALHERMQWERLHGWLRWLYPHLPHTERQDLHAVFHYWAVWAEQQPSDEEWLEVLLSLYPKSFPYYTHHLLQTNRYKQWVDLHLKERYNPFHIPKDILKMIEAEDLPSLLPFFHRAVEELISERSRSSYKDAVKLLKKLRTYYKRLKRADHWEVFIRRLSDKHRRLRAFQEELRKGKLIS